MSADAAWIVRSLLALSRPALAGACHATRPLPAEPPRTSDGRGWRFCLELLITFHRAAESPMRVGAVRRGRPCLATSPHSVLRGPSACARGQTPDSQGFASFLAQIKRLSPLSAARGRRLAPQPRSPARAPAATARPAVPSEPLQHVFDTRSPSDGARRGRHGAASRGHEGHTAAPVVRDPCAPPRAAATPRGPSVPSPTSRPLPSPPPARPHPRGGHCHDVSGRGRRGGWGGRGRGGGPGAACECGRRCAGGRPRRVARHRRRPRPQPRPSPPLPSPPPPPRAHP